MRKILTFISLSLFTLLSPLSASEANYTAFTEEQYATIFGLLQEQVDFQKNIYRTTTEHMERTRTARARFADIGAGPGNLTALFAPHFEKAVAIEPSAVFQKEHEGKAWELFRGAYERYDGEKELSLALCSHVLYHIPVEEWKGWVERMRDSLSDNGVGAIAHLAMERGETNLHSTFDPNYPNSSRIITILNELGASFAVHPFRYEVAGTFEQVHQLCRFFVYENLYTAESVAAMSSVEREALEERIHTFAEGLSNEQGAYHISWNEELILFRKA